MIYIKDGVFINFYVNKSWKPPVYGTIFVYFGGLGGFLASLNCFSDRNSYTLCHRYIQLQYTEYSRHRYALFCCVKGLWHYILYLFCTISFNFKTKMMFIFFFSKIFKKILIIGADKDSADPIFRWSFFASNGGFYAKGHLRPWFKACKWP